MNPARLESRVDTGRSQQPGQLRLGLLEAAVRAFSAALPRRLCRSTSHEIRDFWEHWESATEAQQDVVRAAAQSIEYRKPAGYYGYSSESWESRVHAGTPLLWPADIAQLFARLDGCSGSAEQGPPWVRCLPSSADPPITLATHGGMGWLVKEYLEAGANPDTSDSHGVTALMYACYDRADPGLAALLCVAGGGGSAVRTNLRGDTAEELTRRHVPPVHATPLLHLLGLAGRLCYEQLLTFAAGYHMRLGDASPVCVHCNADLMDQVAAHMHDAWRRQTMVRRAAIWGRFGGPIMVKQLRRCWPELWPLLEPEPADARPSPPRAPPPPPAD